MNNRVRWVINAAAMGASVALLAACGASPKVETRAPTTTHSAAPPAATPKSASPSSAAPKVAELKIGETGRFEDMEPNPDATDSAPNTTFEVKAVSAKYATPAEVGTTHRPKLGQYLVLTLAVKNVGAKDGRFSSHGMMKWENEGTAAQEATTLESVGGPELDTTYKPGQSVTGKLVLDVGGKGGLVSYFDGMTDVPSLVVSLPSS